MIRTRRALPLLAAALTLAACSSPPVQVSMGVLCAQPSLSVNVHKAEPGQVVTVRGRDFFVECSPSPHTQPVPPVALVFSQPGHTYDLLSVPVDLASGTFEVQVTIPDTAQPGNGRIRMANRGSAPARLVIT